MTKKSRWPVVLAGLTLVLGACGGSITDIASSSVDYEATPSLAFLQVGCVAAPAGLISWWPGDGNFDDVAGSNPTVATNGVTFEEGLYSQAFKFAGMNSQMEVDGSDQTLEPEAFTIDFWAERQGPGQGTGDGVGNILIQKALDDSSMEGSVWSYFISWKGNGNLLAGVSFKKDDNDPGSQVFIESASSFADGLPIFIGLSFDGALVTLYVNGGVQGTSDATGLGSVEYDDGSVIIGNSLKAGRASVPRAFDGIIDEVEIFGRALTQPELQEIYEHGKCKGDEEPGPVEIDLDITPGGNPNSINMKSRGVIPVAILGSADFNVNNVDRESLRFGPVGAGPDDGAVPAHEALGHVEHVNDDDFDDLVSHYPIQDTGLTSSDAQACVTGELFDGTTFSACAVLTVKD